MVVEWPACPYAPTARAAVPSVLMPFTAWFGMEQRGSASPLHAPSPYRGLCQPIFFDCVRFIIIIYVPESVLPTRGDRHVLGYQYQWALPLTRPPPLACNPVVSRMPPHLAVLEDSSCGRFPT